MFGVLIHNTDDHLRNHAFLRAGGGWRLSPAFDLNPNPDPGPHATSVSDFDPENSLDAALAVAEYFRLDRRPAAAILARVTAAVRTWRDVAGAHGLDRRSIDRMEPAFAGAGAG